jgi:hypothetical protein
MSLSEMSITFPHGPAVVKRRVHPGGFEVGDD